MGDADTMMLCSAMHDEICYDDTRSPNCPACETMSEWDEEVSKLHQEVEEYTSMISNLMVKVKELDEQNTQLEEAYRSIT